jgi:hypothetical protein
MELFRLFGSILINNDEANNSIDKTGDKADGVSNKFTKGVGTAAKWGIGLVAATGAAVGGMLAMANKTAEAADEIDKLSERTGIGREELQRWKYAAGQSGADVGKLEVGIKKLSDVMDGASNGSKSNIESFKKLGISLNDLKTKSQEDIFNSVMTGLAGMEQGAARNALGNDLLGKSYTEMLPLLNAGAGGMNDLKNRANELGLVMSEEAIKANVVFGDTMDDVKQSIGMVTTNISTAFLPIVQSVLNWVLEHMPEIQATAGTAFKAFGDAVKFVIDNSNWLIPVLGGLLGAIAALNIINTVNALMTAWKASTFATTLAQNGLNAALAANPIGLVVVGIGLLIAAGVLLYKNWDVVKAKAIEIFGTIKSFVNPIISGITSGFRGMVNGVISSLNSMIRGLNKIRFSIPDWIPGLGGKSFGISIPVIPSFAVGTRYLPEDMLIQAHKGEMIVPKSENPYANSGNGQILPSGGLMVNIENFVNNRAQDVKAFAEELEFYRKQASLGYGNTY